MSVIVIGTGGGGHNAVTRLVVTSVHANSQQKAEILNLLQKFIDDVNVLCNEIDNSTPVPK